MSKPRLYWRDDETDRSGFTDSGELPDGPLVEEISALDFYKLNGICVCGKAEMDGIRCKFGASHRSWPRTRYFYHDGSDCLVTTEDGTRPGPEVEEIDKDQYDQIAARQADDEALS